MMQAHSLVHAGSSPFVELGVFCGPLKLLTTSAFWLFLVGVLGFQPVAEDLEPGAAVAGLAAFLSSVPLSFVARLPVPDLRLCT